jgi:two-component system chemotaxis sensor kinase CheA
LAEADQGGEALAEIEEFAKNDFASDPDMMNDFLTNTGELMETLDQMILQLEQSPRDKETIESIFRAAHTLKGAAGMFGFKAIERVMHRMENLFDNVRKGTLVPDSNVIDVVFQGLDVLRTLLGAVKDGKPSRTKTVPIVRALEQAARGKYVKGSMSAGGKSAPAATAAPPAAAEPTAERTGAAAGAKKQSADQSTIRVDLERLDALVNLVGELVIDRTRFASIEEEMRATAPQLKVAGNMQETVQLFGRHMTEIHDIVMKIRMVPIGNAFNKYSRVVRDLARQLGKDIELYIDGEATELDKTIVEQIGDPLVHLIRNSCDHGIETPDVRLAHGKRRAGSIALSARQEGNHIIITIQDDGKGLPVEAIRKKAIERGLITEEMTLAKRDIFNLIFEPGFSTAEKVTNLSGRGVGMDVVRKQISKLKGLIDLDSEPGKGTTTTIRLPLTLAIMQSLLVESSGECFAIPLSSVVESVRIKPEEIQYVGDAEVIKRHGKVLPLLHLQDTLELERKASVSWYSRQDKEHELLTQIRVAKRKERLYVVIVGSGDRRFGIVVDSLLNQQEMVIKSLGPVMRNTPCVAGGAVLGNGEVVLVLDIQELEDRFRSKARGQAA